MPLTKASVNGAVRLLAAIAVCSVGLAAADAAYAADATQTPPASGQKTEQVPGVNPNKSLSKQLNQNNGVITPPPSHDTGIQATVPDPNPGTTPVIPPAGTPGGNPNVQPR